MKAPLVALVHDLSGYGCCSLGAALPILSAMGFSCCSLPTAYLSAHTAIPGSVLLDLTDMMRDTVAHWQSLSLRFRCIYSGFLASAPQADVVADLIRACRDENTLVVVDPVLGDHGTLYRTCTSSLCDGILQLIHHADLITPNLTEAALLLDRSFSDLPTLPQDLWPLAEQLSLHHHRSVTITGIPLPTNQIGILCFDHTCRRTFWVRHPQIPVSLPGTGDVFASVLTGALLQGQTLDRAVRQAAFFACTCVTHATQPPGPARTGVEPGPLLPLLFPHDKNKNSPYR